MIKKITSLMMVCIMLIVCSVVLTAEPAHAKKLTPEQKQAKKDSKNIKFAEKKLKDVRKFIDMNSYTSAERSVKYVEKYYNKISDTGKETPEAQDLKTRMDTLFTEFNEKKSASEATSALQNEIFTLKSRYGSSIRPYLSTLFTLNAGRVKKQGSYSFSTLKSLQEDYPKLKNFEKEFHQTYALLIKSEPEYSYESVSLNDVIDLLKNRDAYRNELVDLICKNDLDTFMETLNGLYTEFEKDHFLSQSWMNDFYGDQKNAPFEAETRCLPYYKWIGKKAPQDKINKIASFKGKFRKLIENIADDKDYKRSNYPYRTKYMKKVAKERGKRANMKLEEVGMESKKAWTINKNGLGIPLSRSGAGYVVYKVKGEPFLRGYKATFTSVYDGREYLDISGISLSRYVTFYED